MLASLLDYEIFQASILFETNKFHHGGAPCSGGPKAIASDAPLNPGLVEKSAFEDQGKIQCEY